MIGEALTVVVSPVAVLVAGLVIAGAALVAPRLGRWRPFETKAQRGRFLVVVGAVAVIGTTWLSNWGAADADAAAARRAEEIRAALDGRTPESIRRDSLLRLYSGEGDYPGGPYRGAAFDGERFTATAEVRKRLQSRCIHVEVGPTGAVDTRVVDGRCGG